MDVEAEEARVVGGIGTQHDWGVPRRHRVGLEGSRPAVQADVVGEAGRRSGEGAMGTISGKNELEREKEVQEEKGKKFIRNGQQTWVEKREGRG